MKVTSGEYDKIQLPTENHSVLKQGRMEPLSQVVEDLIVLVGPVKESRTSAMNFNEYVVYEKKLVKMKYIVKIKVNKTI